MAEGTGGVEVEVAAASDVGCQRSRNEDYFCVVDLTTGAATTSLRQSAGPRGFLFLVCDGMGGHVAGQVASHLAVDLVAERLRSEAEGPEPDGVAATARRLRAATRRANARIHRAAQEMPQLDGMGTTLSAALLAGDKLVVEQVGDSRVYVLRGEKLVQVTRDQSLVEELIRTGQLSEIEAADFEGTNIILQALGVSPDVEVALSTVDLRRGDRLLVCSDGLSGVVDGAEIARAILTTTTPDEACRRLVERAREGGGPDNITCIVARFAGAALAEVAPGEELVYGPYDPGAGAEDARARDEGGRVEIAPELIAAATAGPPKAAWTMTLPAIDPTALTPPSGSRGASRDFWRGVRWLLGTALVLAAGLAIAWYVVLRR